MASLRPLGVMQIYIDALTEFDQGDLLLPDVVLVIARAVIAELAAQNITLDAARPDVTTVTLCSDLCTAFEQAGALIVGWGFPCE